MHIKLVYYRTIYHNIPVAPGSCHSRAVAGSATFRVFGSIPWLLTIVNSARNGNVVASVPVNEGDEVILSTDKGRVIRCAVKEIRSAGRNTQGVRIFKLSGEEKVVSAIKVEENFI